MKSSIAKLWTAALRSGQYKQTGGKLRGEFNGITSFCCLGVLCNLHAQAHPDIAARQPTTNGYIGQSLALPCEVMKWAGMASSLGRFRGTTLASENDQGASFNKIADLIDTHVKTL